MQKITNLEIKNFNSICDQTIDDWQIIDISIGYPNVAINII